MSRWNFPIALDARATTPLFLQIARAIAGDVGRGRLRPGDRLPGTRTLAELLDVHRSTVVAAYAELTAQGWVQGAPGSATIVAATSPDVGPVRDARPARGGVPAEPGFALAGPPPIRLAQPRAATPGMLQLWGGVPDTRLVDCDLLGRALRRAARLHGRGLLRYADDARGHAGLRAAIAAMLSSARGLAAGADDVQLTGGSQQALDLVARALVRPGDVIAVEALGYRSAWAAFARAGARLEPVPVDGEGLQTVALGRLARRGRLRAVYVTPHHQYPTTVVMSPRRRVALRELARLHRFAVVEDDYDHEYHYEGRPVLPLASADGHGQVIYVGGLAKILAPGLRIGYVVAPAALLARLAEEKAVSDRQGNLLVEAAVAELMHDGDVQRHVRRTRRIYHARRDALVAALRKQLGGALELEVPPGGLALWARAAPGIDVERWRERAFAAGVQFMAGAVFSFAGEALPCLRLGFGGSDARELAEAARRLARSLPGAARR